MGNDKNNNQTPKISRWQKFLNKFRRKKTKALTEGPENEKTQKKQKPRFGWFRRWRNRKKTRELPEPSQDNTEVDANSKWVAKKGRSDTDVSSKKISRKASKENAQFDATTPDTPTETTQCDADASRTNLDQSLGRTSRKLRKKASAEDGFTASFKRSFKKFKADNLDNWKTIKTFMSRSYKEKSMQKVVARVEARQHKRSENINSSDTGGGTIVTTQPKLHQGDDVFPTRKPHRSKKDGSASNSSKSSATPAANVQEHPLIDTNNENDGQLFLASGKPFWQQVGRGKPGEEDEDEVTDDELPMNADMILDVHRGKIKLKDMPTVAVMLDPYGKLPDLEKHDNLFFTRDVIFSNTVRSMINLNDETEHRKNKTIIRRCQWEMPTTIHRYSKTEISNVKTEDFVPKCPERK
uniref:Uncharacterized protein n=1 Tax=Panagrolaimus sp. JU765 TaxID=591449 RepID=A0AC34QGM3_9BILA